MVAVVVILWKANGVTPMGTTSNAMMKPESTTDPSVSKVNSTVWFATNESPLQKAHNALGVAHAAAWNVSHVRPQSSGAAQRKSRRVLVGRG